MKQEDVYSNPFRKMVRCSVPTKITSEKKVKIKENNTTMISTIMIKKKANKNKNNAINISINDKCKQ
jgi:hypothetical protein